jgi:hypothetical protein
VLVYILRLLHTSSITYLMHNFNMVKVICMIDDEVIYVDLSTAIKIQLRRQDCFFLEVTLISYPCLIKFQGLISVDPRYSY